MTTYKLEGDTLIMTRPTGQSYRATLDGADAPYSGDPNITTVSVKRIDANTMEETDKLDGKAISMAGMTVSPDGKSMTIAVKNIEAGSTSEFTARRQ